MVRLLIPCVLPTSAFEYIIFLISQLILKGHQMVLMIIFTCPPKFRTKVISGGMHVQIKHNQELSWKYFNILLSPPKIKLDVGRLRDPFKKYRNYHQISKSWLLGRQNFCQFLWRILKIRLGYVNQTLGSTFHHYPFLRYCYLE